MFTSADLGSGNRTNRHENISALSAQSYDRTISTEADNNLVTSSKRKGKFFGITTTGGAGNNLQVIGALKKHTGFTVNNTMISYFFSLDCPLLVCIQIMYLYLAYLDLRTLLQSHLSACAQFSLDFKKRNELNEIIILFIQRRLQKLKSINAPSHLFLVPFLNIPFGASTTSSYYGSNYATTPSYGTSSSLLGVNSSSIIYAVIIGLAAIILIPLFIYSFTGVSTSPYGRSKDYSYFKRMINITELILFSNWFYVKLQGDDIQSMLTNLASRIDDALKNQYNIDAPSCLQRAICTQITSSSNRMSEGTAGSVEKIIEGLAS